MNEFAAQVVVFLCVLVIAAIFSTSTIKQIADDSKSKKEEDAAMRRRKAEISGKAALTRKERFVQNLRYNLDVIHMPKEVFMVMEIGAGIIGFFLGKLILSSFELAVALAIVCVLLPVVFVIVRASWYRQHEAAMLENCMVMITGAYRANKDIIKSVKDNIDKPNMPQAFKNFLSEVAFVDSNVEKALRRVGASFKNRYFQEWIEVLIKAQYDSNMMDILPVIIDEMDEAKKAQNESSAAMKAVWREYAIWVVTVICVPLVLKINDEWYNALVNTLPGKCMVVALLLGIINSLRVMIKISKPVDV